MSYLFDIGRSRRKSGRFIGRVRRELLKAFVEEQRARGLTRDELAQELGVHKSVVTRRLNGSSNLTLRVVAEMADALGRDIRFSLQKPTQAAQKNYGEVERLYTETDDIPSPAISISGPAETRATTPGADPLPTAA